jgi:DNA-binding transcriptional LysR family regulator
LDLVIAQDWEDAPRPSLGSLAKAPLLDDIADVALRENHPLARRKVVNLDELRSDGGITWEQTACSRGSSVATDPQDGGRDSEGDVVEVREAVLRCGASVDCPGAAVEVAAVQFVEQCVEIFSCEPPLERFSDSLVVPFEGE